MLGVLFTKCFYGEEERPVRCPMCGGIMDEDGKCSNRACVFFRHPVTPEELLFSEEDQDA